jgi:hypothetical protein
LQYRGSGYQPSCTFGYVIFNWVYVASFGSRSIAYTKSSLIIIWKWESYISVVVDWLSKIVDIVMVWVDFLITSLYTENVLESFLNPCNLNGDQEKVYLTCICLLKFVVLYDDSATISSGKVARFVYCLQLKS